ncbi:MAG: hypothetical protein KJO72_06245 [Gammaproteobacteria bacterium]|nr:hypothetical protein [Gammaproteobacteria bacterium]MBT8056524.1 hypothetical protein [Gammaproteobacteria bacterium]
MKTRLIKRLLAGATLFVSAIAFAQAPPSSAASGWTFTADAGFAVQPETDIDGAGSAFEFDRTFFSAGVDYRWNYRNSVGLSVGAGKTDYRFAEDGVGRVDGPWGEVDDARISVPMRFAYGDKASIFVIPSIRSYGEDGASSSDSQTWGLFGGVAWRLRNGLTIGPGFGTFSQLEDGARFFPILIIDWDISERWNLSTGRGLAASQGPGLTLSYELTPAWSLGLAGRYEEIEFRLDDEGAAPGGVGEDRAFPLVVTGSWSPDPAVRLAAFAGLEFGGQLKLYDDQGLVVESRDYDTTPVYGATASFRF